MTLGEVGKFRYFILVQASGSGKIIYLNSPLKQVVTEARFYFVCFVFFVFLFLFFNVGYLYT